MLESAEGRHWQPYGFVPVSANGQPTFIYPPFDGPDGDSEMFRHLCVG